MSSRFEFLGFGFWVCGFSVWGSEFWGPGFGGSGFGVLGFAVLGLGVLGLGFWVWGSGFAALVFRFWDRVLGFGTRKSRGFRFGARPWKTIFV